MDKYTHIKNEYMDAVIGTVSETENGWNVSLLPDGTTWLSIQKEEHSQIPEVGDIITIRKPRVVEIKKVEVLHG